MSSLSSFTITFTFVFLFQLNFWSSESQCNYFMEVTDSTSGGPFYNWRLLNVCEPKPRINYAIIYHCDEKGEQVIQDTYRGDSCSGSVYYTESFNVSTNHSDAYAHRAQCFAQDCGYAVFYSILNAYRCVDGYASDWSYLIDVCTFEAPDILGPTSDLYFYNLAENGNVESITYHHYQDSNNCTGYHTSDTFVIDQCYDHDIYERSFKYETEYHIDSPTTTMTTTTSSTTVETVPTSSTTHSSTSSNTTEPSEERTSGTNHANDLLCFMIVAMAVL